MAKKGRGWDPFADLCAEMNAASDCDEGEQVCLWEDENLSEPRFRVSTGSNLLDMVLGGGIPTGRIIELYGWPGVGKSTLCSHIGASAQSQGGYYFVMDAEASVDKERDHRIGILPERYMYGRVDTVESGFNMIHSFVDGIQQIPTKYKQRAKEVKSSHKKELLEKAKAAENLPSVVVWDTIAAAPAEAEVKEDKGEGLAEKARVIRRELRGLTNKLADNNVVLILVNHLTENIKGYKPETACGWAIKFWASARIELKRSAAMNVSGREVGLYTKARIHKSKFSPQGYEVIFPINFLNGIDRLYEAFDYLLASKSGVVTQNQAWFYVHDYPNPSNRMAMYYGQLADKADKDPQLVEYLLTRMKEIFYGL